MIAADCCQCPSAEELERFIRGRGELPRPEVLALVRHLLVGCPRCLEITRRIWMLGEPCSEEEIFDSEAAGEPMERGCRGAGAVWT